MLMMLLIMLLLTLVTLVAVTDDGADTDDADADDDDDDDGNGDGDADDDDGESGSDDDDDDDNDDDEEESGYVGRSSSSSSRCALAPLSFHASRAITARPTIAEAHRITSGGTTTSISAGAAPAEVRTGEVTGADEEAGAAPMLCGIHEGAPGLKMNGFADALNLLPAHRASCCSSCLVSSYSRARHSSPSAPSPEPMALHLSSSSSASIRACSEMPQFWYPGAVRRPPRNQTCSASAFRHCHSSYASCPRSLNGCFPQLHLTP